MPEIEAGESLAFHRPDISRNVIRQLRRGKYAIQAEIDLHGLTVSEAQTELRSFITECVDRNLRCIRVVHGKGLRSGDKGPVLKANVNYWLPNWDDVLAFCSALPRHGGTGAIYVLLKTL
jgi:DNA-nicking Smr family endonuclease